MEFVRRTRATLRSAEFGFFGVVVYTRVQTPRRCGAATFFLRPLPDFKPGVASFFVFGLRPLRTSWDVVGIRGPMVAALRGWLSDMRGWRRRSGHQLAPLVRQALTALVEFGLEGLELDLAPLHELQQRVRVRRRLAQK